MFIICISFTTLNLELHLHLIPHCQNQAMPRTRLYGLLAAAPAYFHYSREAVESREAHPEQNGDVSQAQEEVTPLTLTMERSEQDCQGGSEVIPKYHD